MSNQTRNPMKTNIGIAENHLQAVVLELNRVLADEYIVYTKTRNYLAASLSIGGWRQVGVAPMQA